jgi:nucleotide-binding universal stress UspA family protein
LKILALVDHRQESLAAADFASGLAARLAAELGVVVVRHATQATEAPAPVGVATALAGWQPPPGIAALLAAAGRLAARGLIAELAAITLRDRPHGHVFHAPRLDGAGRVAFIERFGALVAELNQEIDEGRWALVVAAAPRRGPLGRFVSANLPRKLALDLHASFLVVRGGGLESRLVVCVDGSPPSRRIFPLLRRLLPALGGPIEILCVLPPAGAAAPEPSEHCLAQARAWLGACEREVRLSRPRAARRATPILAAAGSGAIIVTGESRHHDLRRRTLGTLPLKLLARTDSSFLMVKGAVEPDPEHFEEGAACPLDGR